MSNQQRAVPTRPVDNQDAIAAEDAVDRRTTAGGVLLLVGVALAAANMRPAVTSLGSVLGDVRDSLGVSNTWASVITAVPTVCFGLAAIAAPLLARRLGTNRVVGISLAVLTAAMLLRVVNGPWTVIAGTVVVCAAIAMSNVLIPVVVKRSFPDRVGLATGVYTTAMAAGGALGSSLTPWLRGAIGWRLALVTWAVLAVAALCVWIPAVRGQSDKPEDGERPVSPRALFGNPLAWLITVYFGLQSMVAYIVMGWLPEVLRGAGMDSTSAGALLGLVLMVGVPMSMVLPTLVARSNAQSGWAAVLGLFMISGLLGLILVPMALPVLWALLIGIGLAVFPFALTLISLRTSSASRTAELSGMAQSIGYLLACSGPFLFGMLHEATGGWTVSLVAVLTAVIVQTCVGIAVGRPRTI